MISIDSVFLLAGAGVAPTKGAVRSPTLYVDDTGMANEAKISPYSSSSSSSSFSSFEDFSFWRSPAKDRQGPNVS